MADSSPFPVLPQYQGDAYQAQRQMALAQALQSQAMTPLSDSQAGWNQMRVVPRASALSGLSKIGEALLAGNAGNNATQMQRNLGQEQWQGMQQMFGGGQQPQLQQGNNTAVPDTSGQNYGMMQPGAQGAQQTQPAPQQSLGPQGGTTSPMNPVGLPPSAAAMMYMRDPSGYMSSMVAPSYKPTDATLAARAAGVDPQQANAAALAKQNTIAPAEGRPGGTTFMPQVGPDGKTTWVPHYNQQVPAGGEPLYDGAGNIVGVRPLAGASDVAGQMAGATAGAQAGYHIMPGFDASGRPVYTTAAALAGGPQGGQAPQTGFPGVTGLGAQAPGAPSGGGAISPSLPVGSDALIKDYVGRNDEVSDAAKIAPADIQALQNIGRLSGRAKTGVGFDRVAYLKSMASVLPGISPNSSDKDVADEMGKYVSQMSGRNGGRSDAALENAIHSTPNSGMSPAAIQDLVPNMIGLKMSDIGNANARAQWLESHGNNPASLIQYEKQWNQTYNPDVYRLQALPPQAQQQYVQSLPPAQAHALLQSRQALKSMGAMPDLPQVQ